MGLPSSAHTSQPWRIHELTRDFRLEDVWAMPTPGGPEDFPRLVELVTTIDPSKTPDRIVQALFAIRMKMGGLLGWDAPETGEGSPAATMRDRLPEDLRRAPSGPGFGDLPFSPLYLLEDEFAAEIVNKTMHGVVHLGWVPDGKGAHRGQLAVLVKPKGLLGTVYMAAIKPFRHLIVYPSMMRRLGQRWQDVEGSPASHGTT